MKKLILLVVTAVVVQVVVVAAVAIGRPGLPTATRTTSASTVVTRTCTTAAVRMVFLFVASRSNKSWRSEDLNIYPNLQV